MRVEQRIRRRARIDHEEAAAWFKNPMNFLNCPGNFRPMMGAVSRTHPVKAGVSKRELLHVTVSSGDVFQISPFRLFGDHLSISDERS